MPIPPHLILFLNWDNASALKFEQCPNMPIFAASIDTGNCILFRERKPDRNPISYVLTYIDFSASTLRKVADT